MSHSSRWTDDQGRFVADHFHMGMRGEELKAAYDREFPDDPRSVWALENAVYYRESAVERYEELRRDDDTPDEASATWDPSTGVLRSDDIRTIDELMGVAELDPDEWSIDYVKPRAWQVGMKRKVETESGNVIEVPDRIQLHGIEAKLTRLFSRDALRDLKDEILDDIRAQGGPPAELTRQDPPESGYLVEVFLPDLHIDKIAIAEEAGSDWGVEAAVEAFETAVDTIVDRALKLGPPARFLIPIGNDFFNVDTPENTTTKGTPQEVDGRWKAAFRTGRSLLSRTFHRLARIAPVDVVVVPGNHDEATVWFLGEVLEAEFEDDPRVRIDNRMKLRKAYTFGEVFLGFTHGKHEKRKDLPYIFGQEERRAWGRCRWREIHVGHDHEERVTETEDGTRIRTSPALCGPDEWHYKKGYIGALRGAQGFVFDAETGPVAIVQYTHPGPDIDAATGPPLDGTP